MIEGQTIIRTTKDRQHPYVVISRDVFSDERLSWEARGVLGYLLSKPDNWEVRFQDLVRRGPGARDRMRRILGELSAAGYLLRERVHGPDGRLIWVSVVYERPQASSTAPSPQKAAMVDAPSPPFPSTVQPSTVKPSTANPPLYVVVNPLNKDSQNREREPAPPPSIADFVVTDELSLWVYQAAHKAGISPSRIDLETETEIWRDQIASGARDYPADQAADWRVWIHRAINYARTHPTKEPTDGTAQHRPQRPDDPRATAHSAAELHAALTALSPPGGPA